MLGELFLLSGWWGLPLLLIGTLPLLLVSIFRRGLK